MDDLRHILIMDDSHTYACSVHATLAASLVPILNPLLAVARDFSKPLLSCVQIGAVTLCAASCQVSAGSCSSTILTTKSH